MLTDLQKDAITETLNIGVGKAAASLSQMVQDEVLLCAPVVDFIDIRELSERMVGDEHAKEMIGIEQEFCGSFRGREFLLFNREKSLELVRAMIKEDIPLDMLTDFEQEAFLEIGNIILNACTGSIANFLDEELAISLPSFRSGNVNEVLLIQETLEEAYETSKVEEYYVLYLLINFSISKMEIEGHMMFLMEIDSIESFKNRIEELICSKI